VVVNDQNVVLGLLRKASLDGDVHPMAEQAMECGPKTYRFDAELKKAADYMQRQGVDSVLVTTSDGQLEGLLRQKDVQRALATL